MQLTLVYGPTTQGMLYTDGDTVGVPYADGEVAGGDAFFILGGFQAKSREFIDSVKSGRQPSSNFADALKTMEIAERILAQSILARQ